MRDRVEVLAHIDIDYVLIARLEQSFDFSQCILASEIGSKAVTAWVELVLEDRSMTFRTAVWTMRSMIVGFPWALL